jgi:hypothetical protein
MIALTLTAERDPSEPGEHPEDMVCEYIREPDNERREQNEHRLRHDAKRASEIDVHHRVGEQQPVRSWRCSAINA